MVTITLCTRQQKRHWCIEQSYGLSGRGRGWEDLGEWHWNMCNIMYEAWWAAVYGVAQSQTRLKWLSSSSSSSSRQLIRFLFRSENEGRVWLDLDVFLERRRERRNSKLAIPFRQVSCWDHTQVQKEGLLSILTLKRKPCWSLPGICPHVPSLSWQWIADQFSSACCRFHQ